MVPASRIALAGLALLVCSVATATSSRDMIQALKAEARKVARAMPAGAVCDSPIPDSCVLSRVRSARGKVYRTTVPVGEVGQVRSPPPRPRSRSRG